MSSRFSQLPILVLSLVLSPQLLGELAAAPAPHLAAAVPSAWIDGAWTPLAGFAPATPGPGRTVTAAFATAAAAVGDQGSGIEQVFPVAAADGSAERAVFAAVVDGESCLWSTDGTATGTFRVEPGGACVPLRSGFPFVGTADGVAYFVAGHFPFRYWRTDGTAAGTWPLTSFSDEGLWNRRFNLMAVPPLGLVVFTADDGVHGAEPWVSDGSPGGATLLGDLAPGGDGSFPFRYQAMGSRLLFFVWRGNGEYGLWASDGTPPGTALVDTVGSETYYAGPGLIYPLGERAAFFLGGVTPCVSQLWATDGTAAGTGPVLDFPGTSCATSGLFQAVRVAGFPADVFFGADDGVHGGELWRTDGTAAGTLRLTDLAPEQPFRMHFPLNFPPVGIGGDLLFAADDGEHGMEPWTSDGTPGGAALLADVCPGGCSSTPGWMQEVAGRVLFSAQEPTSGSELWISDGTTAGTERATDLCPGPCGADVFREVVFGDSLLFIADDGSHGEEWWIFTLPAGPAVRLTDLAPARPFGGILNMVPLRARAMFTADDGIHGREPWVTDGTPSGTHLLVDLQGGETGTPPDAPAAPANLRLVELGGGFARLEWEDRSDDETGFVIDILRPGTSAWLSTIGIGAGRTSLEVRADLGTTGYRVRAVNGPVQSPPSNAVFITVTGFCTPSDEVLCLGGGRFAVSVQWNNQHAGPGEQREGRGHAVAAGSGVDDSGYFWFFTPDNLELVVKALDGTSVNGHFWVFWGALSDVEYWLHVEDTIERRWRIYHNPAGQICGGSDTGAFPLEGVSGGFARTAATAVAPHPPTSSGRPFAVASGPATRFLAVDAPADRLTAAAHPFAPCVPDERTLCLLDGSLAVTVDWRDQHNGGSGVGHARPYTDLTGFFWFFHPANVELVVKALDGRTVNGKIWVFYGALSDVGYTIRVENRADGHAVRTYENPAGMICGRGDTAAF